MSAYLVGVASTLTGTAVLVVLAYYWASSAYRREHHYIRDTIGLDPDEKRILILVSGMAASLIENIAGGRPHRVKSHLVDMGEIRMAGELSSFFKGQSISSRVAKRLQQYGFGGHHRIVDVEIDSSDPHSRKEDPSEYQSLVLLGSGVFNREVKRFHDSHAVARIIDTGRRLSPEGPAVREIRLPGESYMRFSGREAINHLGDANRTSERRDLALIQRVRVQHPRRAKDRTYFVIAGLGSGGTQAAAQWVISNWSIVRGLAEEGARSFEIVLGWWTSDFSRPPPIGELEIMYPYELTKAYASRKATVEPNQRAVVEKASSTLRSAHRPIFFFDFDGVLSPIVPEADRATPFDESIPTIRRLLDRFATVCIVSSRPLEFLVDRIPVQDDQLLGRLTIVGSKGLESYENGEREEVDGADHWRSEVESAVEDARRQVRDRGLSEVVVEPKGLSLSIHYRHNLAAERQVESIARWLARKYDFLVGEGKKVYELQPDAGISKGTVVAARMGSHDWALFAGDDLGDIPGFRALHERRSTSVRTFCVGVTSPEHPDEVPSELRDEADLLVSGPQGLQELLRQVVPDDRADYRPKSRLG
jgi:trehalose 6-phosphate phosphatase